ncbi:hypothetical protein [Kitasatospora sp. NPDC048407]|uniref:hypothetical protein n=1 Tax=Kitasatospora sp. NPDC048407 TaxID=3364051 RepID=UPI003711C7DE
MRAETARTRRAECVAQQRIDPTASRFRERCAREASYLRRLIQRLDEGEGQNGNVAAGEVLEQAVSHTEGIGLTVSARYHALPALPALVASSLAAAVTEALNNVRHHAGTSTAHLTATRQGDGIAVTVVDDGCGLDTALTRTGGTGLRQSIHSRMKEIGGTGVTEVARMTNSPCDEFSRPLPSNLRKQQPIP